jgi:hypothetical protein
MLPVGFEPAIPAREREQMHAFGYGYLEARNDTTRHDTTQPSKQTADK